MAEFDLHGLIENLAHQELVVGLFLFGSGLVFMLLGIRIFRALLAVSFGVIGFVLGATIAVEGWASLGAGLAGAVCLAVLSLYVIKPATSLLAGGWAAIMVIRFVDGFGFSQNISMLVGLFAFAGAVALTFVIFDEMVAAVTSFQGTMLLLGGLVVFISQNPLLWAHIRVLAMSTPIFGPFLLFAGTLAGICLQLTDQRQKESGMSV
jgi:hypothetical protein